MAESNTPLVYISYANSDLDWLERILEHLEPAAERNQFEIWYDKKLEVGDNWSKRLEDMRQQVLGQLVFSSVERRVGLLEIDPRLPGPVDSEIRQLEILIELVLLFTRQRVDVDELQLGLALGVSTLLVQPDRPRELLALSLRQRGCHPGRPGNQDQTD